MADGSAPPYVGYLEFNSGDPDLARSFYREVFGWDPQPWGADDYFVHSDPDASGIDVGFSPTEDGQPITVATIHVDDLPGYLGKVILAGGAIVVPKFTIPGTGHGAYVTDPTGMVVGLFERDPNAG